MKSLPLVFTALTLPLLASSNVVGQSSDAAITFYEVRERYYQGIEGQDTNTVKGYKQFKRWESMMLPRVYPTGQLLNPDILWTEFQREQQKRGADWNSRSGGTWKHVGPPYVPSNSGGAGRVNSITLDPTDPNIMWTGTPDGGLWKTTDGGESWSSNTDWLPNLGVTEVAINPQNTDIMYIATGDGFGYALSGEFWGGTYSNGVMKSTDGGDTWSDTGLNWSLGQSNQINALQINPDNPDILLAGTNTGVWRSTDAAANWTLIQAGDFRSVELKPGDPNTVYAGDGDIWRSLDGGQSFSLVQSTTHSACNLAVTPANPDYVYAYCLQGGHSIRRSTNSGATFTNLGGVSGLSTFGWWTSAFGVSPTDENVLFVGGVDLHRSTNGGSSWTKVSDWFGWPNPNYSHADHREIKFHPTEENTVFNGNDGGVFKSTNLGTSWTDLSDDLHIMQLYRFGNSVSNSDILYAGSQDNGVNRKVGLAWTQVFLADGMECAVHPNDPNIVYSSWQNGNMIKSTNGGNSFFNVNPGTSSDWITTFELDPSDPNTIYYGGGELFRSTNAAGSWSPITSGQSGGENITWITVAESDPDVIYWSHGSKVYGGSVGIFNTTNGGSSWNDITGSLPVSDGWITYIEVDNTDPMTAWATFSGYQPVDKVWETTDGGQSWSSIAGTLPNIPINTIVHDRSLNDGLYIGTDFGVYYRDDSMNDWIPFMNGLPNVIVTELEIQERSQKLRAATYGRGIWEADIAGVTSVDDASVTSLASTLMVFPNPNPGEFTLQMNVPGQQEIGISVVNAEGRVVHRESLGSYNGTYSKPIQLDGFANGVYQLQVQVGDQVLNEKIILRK